MSRVDDVGGMVRNLEGKDEICVVGFGGGKGNEIRAHFSQNSIQI